MVKVFCTFLLIFLLHVAVQAQNELVEAWIDLSEASAEVLSVTGNTKSLTNQREDYNYTLKVITTSKNGVSSNTQSGTFTLLGLEEKEVSVVSLNRVEDQQIKVEFTILIGHLEVATTSFKSDPSNKAQSDWSYAAQNEGNSSSSVVPSSRALEKKAIKRDSIASDGSAPLPLEVRRVLSEQRKSAGVAQEPKMSSLVKDSLQAVANRSIHRRVSSPDSTGVAAQITETQTPKPSADVSGFEELEISGLIIDETRSKIGRDFYDLFYRKWQAPNGAESFSIILKEYPTRGRVARVGIEVNGKLVFQPVLQPREEILERRASQAVNVVSKYLLDQKQLNAELESQDQSGSGIF